MKEIQDIIFAYNVAKSQGKQIALASVVSVQGSSYRMAGARMLITEEGQLTGAISGGCLEGDALRKAQLVMLTQTPRLVVYDTNDEADTTFGIGLGCNGIIHVLIEPIDYDNSENPVELLKKIGETREPVVLVTLFSFKKTTFKVPGTCLLIKQNGELYGKLHNDEMAKSVLLNAKELINNQETEIRPYEEGLVGLLHVVAPVISLVVVGAGNDVLPLVKVAALLGWDITIVDGRANYANSQRFPQAKVIVAESEDILNYIRPDRRTVFVLMSHSYLYDFKALQALVVLPIPYIGCLGPQKKLKKMLKEMREGGAFLGNGDTEKLFGPTGLDIGAESPTEIALSIVSEIRAVLNKRNGGFLKERKSPIHAKEVRQGLERARTSNSSKETKPSISH